LSIFTRERARVGLHQFSGRVEAQGFVGGEVATKSKFVVLGRTTDSMDVGKFQEAPLSVSVLVMEQAVLLVAHFSVGMFDACSTGLTLGTSFFRGETSVGTAFALIRSDPISIGTNGTRGTDERSSRGVVSTGTVLSLERSSSRVSLNPNVGQLEAHMAARIRRLVEHPLKEDSVVSRATRGNLHTIKRVISKGTLNIMMMGMLVHVPITHHLHLHLHLHIRIHPA
jgi:hypothetical protein